LQLCKVADELCLSVAIFAGQRRSCLDWQIRQLRNVHCYAPRLVAGHQVRSRSPASFRRRFWNKILGAGFCDYLRPCIAMNAAHVSAEAAIITRSGFTVDLADFAIASQLSMVPSEAATEFVNKSLPGPATEFVTAITFWSFSTSRARKERNKSRRDTENFAY
jgi:hypothetical protein